MTDLALCVICAEHEPAPVICERCRQRAWRNLATIGKLRRDLDPTPGRGRGGRSTGKPGSRPPANLHILAMTDVRSCSRISVDTGEHDVDDVANIDAELVREARLLIESMRLAHPLRDVFHALRIVNLHFEVLMRGGRADEVAAVLMSCAVGLAQVLRDDEPSVGRCTATHPRRTACGGPLRLAWEGDLPDDPDEQVAPTHVVCGWCHDWWPLDRDTLVAMLRVVKPKAFPVSRQWAAEVLGVPVGTIDVWAHRGHVRVYADKQIDLMGVLTRIGDTLPE